jgi:hypothetical protein
MHKDIRRECTIITIHTWTAIFLKHLANTSFMASLQTQTEPHFGLTLWACILLSRPARYLAVYCNGLSFTPSAFYNLGCFSLMYCTSKHHDTTHTCIYITLVLLFISSFYTSSIFLGRRYRHGHGQGHGRGCDHGQISPVKYLQNYYKVSNSFFKKK